MQPISNLRILFLTGMPASGKSTLEKEITKLAQNDYEHVEFLNDRNFIEKSLLNYNESRENIPELVIPGKGTQYILPVNGEVEVTDGSLFLSNSEITSFSLKNPLFFHRARREMLEYVDNKVILDSSNNTLFVIEWGTAKNIVFDENNPTNKILHDSKELIRSIKTSLNDNIINQIGFLELHTPDNVRERRNESRPDKLPPEVYKIYKNSGGFMPEELQKLLTFEKINNDGTPQEFKMNAQIAYESLKEKYRQNVEGQTGSIEWYISETILGGRFRY